MRPANSRTLLPILAALALAARTRGPRVGKASESLPGRSAVTVTVKGKPRVYFHLTPRTRSPVVLAGPASLRVISRACPLRPKRRDGGIPDHGLEGGKPLQATGENGRRGVRRQRPGVASLGRGRRMTVQVPDGQHELKLVAHGGARALVRLSARPPSVPRRG